MLIPLALALSLAASQAGPPQGPSGEAVVSETRPVFGSVATVTLAGVDPRKAAIGLEAAFAHLDRADWSMNEWRPGTPLANLNAAAGGDWIPLPGDLCQALERALDGGRRTEGRFDPTWAALRDLWRFDGSQSAPPSDAALAARCPLVGWRGLSLRPRPGARAGGGCEGRLARPGMAVGLGGLAKGWAVDGAARALRALGYENFLVQAGGDLYAAGRRGGRPWHVEIRDPRGGRETPMAALDLSDRAFSTTGDYEHAFEAGGQRYHHVIDPRTCRPARASRAVTILARSAVDAEILGKAVFIEGGRAGVATAERWGALALVVEADGAVVMSKALEGRLLAR